MPTTARDQMVDVTAQLVNKGKLNIVTQPGWYKGLQLAYLDGGGVACTTDRGSGRVALSVYPWEITITSAQATPDESVQNRLSIRVNRAWIR